VRGRRAAPECPRQDRDRPPADNENVIRGTGWDEITLGTVLFVAGCLYLYFRDAADRSVARYYARWRAAFPRLMDAPMVRQWYQDPVRRWVVTLTGVVLIFVGSGFVAWGLVWGDTG
jgi:hypothetical protein